MSARWFGRGLLDDRGADEGPPVPSRLPRLVHDKEHVALLAVPARSDLLRRKDDLLDEGVAAIFGLAGGQAELVSLSFDAGRFTPAEAALWLARRGLAPLLLVPGAGGGLG
jgi:hypothetical protein